MRIIRISSLLEAELKQWVLEHVPFPPKKLAMLKERLEKAHYLKALGTLKIVLRDVDVKYIPRTGLYFFAEYFIESDGPPLARTTIYTFMRNNRLKRIQFTPVLSKRICVLTRPTISHYDAFDPDTNIRVIFEEEIPEARKKYEEAARKEADDLMRNIEIAFRHIEYYTIHEPNPA